MAQRSWMPALESTPAAVLPGYDRLCTAHEDAVGSGDKGARGLRAAKEAHVYAQAGCFKNQAPGPVHGSERFKSSTKAPCPAFADSGSWISTQSQAMLGTSLGAVEAKKQAPGLWVNNVTLATPAVRKMASTSLSELRRIHFGPNVFEGTQGLADMLRVKPGWELLEVVQNHHVFSEEGPVAAVADTLAAACIERLVLLGNNIASGPSQTLLGKLAESCHISSLDFSGNDLSGTDDDAQGLQTLLRDNKFLTALSLRESGIGPAAAKFAAATLAASDTVQNPPEHEPDAPPADLKEDYPTDPHPPPAEGEPDAAPPPDPPELAEQVAEYKARMVEELTAKRASESQALHPQRSDDDPAAEADPPRGEDSEDGEDGDGDPPADAADADAEAPADAVPPAAQEQDHIEAEAEELAVQYAQFLRDARSVEVCEEKARHAVAMEFFVERAEETKPAELAERASAFAVQVAREAAEAQRRSGWSRIEQLDLSSNPMKSAGAASIAALLRADIPKTDEEIAKEEVCLQEERAARKAAEAERLAAELEKKAEEEAAAAEAAAQAAAEAGGEGDAGGGSTEDPPAEGETPAPAEAQEGGAEGDGEGVAPTEEEAAKEGEEGGEAEEAPVERTKKGLRTLKFLDLSDCEIGSKGLQQISNVLASNNTTLEALLLQRNKFGVTKETKQQEDEEAPPLRVEKAGVVTSGIAALSACLAKTKTLKQLDLCGNLIGAANGACLFEGLAANSSLTSLSLEVNRLGGTGPAGPSCPEDANHIRSCLAGLSAALPATALRTLRLRGNFLQPYGLSLLQEALCNATELTELDLSHNLLGDKGIEMVAPIASGCMTLTQLSLSGNGVTAVGLWALSGSLNRIAGLDLSENPGLFKSEDAVAALCPVAAEGKLRELNLSSTGLHTATAGTVLGLIAAPSMLSALDIGDNTLSSEDLLMLLKGFEPSGLHNLSMWTRTHATEAEWLQVLTGAQSLLASDAPLRKLHLNPPNTPDVQKLHAEILHTLETRR